MFQVHGIDQEGRGSHLPTVEAAVDFGVLPEAATMPSRHRSLRFVVDSLKALDPKRPIREADKMLRCVRLLKGEKLLPAGNGCILPFYPDTSLPAGSRSRLGAVERRPSRQ